MLRLVQKQVGLAGEVSGGGKMKLWMLSLVFAFSREHQTQRPRLMGG